MLLVIQQNKFVCCYCLLSSYHHAVPSSPHREHCVQAENISSYGQRDADCRHCLLHLVFAEAELKAAM
jgi:hypothetical protein